ncbi:hypothetical protein HDU81_010796 [Chytriomyces hyalinus]|nr:hypothetical protein HDU81_010796 [Chytriomyces hyalinus]
MTVYENSKPRPELLSASDDQDLIDDLVYASYQVPRFLFFAHKTWSWLRAKGTTNREVFLQSLKAEVKRYYPELAALWISKYSVRDLAHIILACSVRCKVDRTDSFVPGTEISWSTLTRSALVFSCLDNCYLIPLSLIPNATGSSEKRMAETKKRDVEDFCGEVVANLRIKDLFVSYDELCSYDLHGLGLAYESLFVASLDVKYYLHSFHEPCTDVPLSEIYDLDGERVVKTRISELFVNFSKGISIPTEECAVEFPERAITHHKEIRNAHYELIIPAKFNNTRCYAPVSAKCLFLLSSNAVIQNQLDALNGTQNQLLFWLYLGKGRHPLEEENPDVLFLDGSGCCNGLPLDLFVLVKKLKSSDNQ